MLLAKVKIKASVIYILNTIFATQKLSSCGNKIYERNLPILV
jgi:hypothetical protein